MSALSPDPAASRADRDGLERQRSKTQRDRDNARADRELAARHLARVYQDDLTGVLTRRPGKDSLEREMRRAVSSGTPLTIAFADVDGLKGVNDRHGHADGDRLLQAVGAALLDNLRPYDVVVRYGGDEFVCGLVDSSRQDAERSMRRVLDQLARHDSPASLSLGYAELSAYDTLDRLVQRADTDMYVTRQRARSTDTTTTFHEVAAQLTCMTCNEPMRIATTDDEDPGRQTHTARCATCGRSVHLASFAPHRPDTTP